MADDHEQQLDEIIADYLQAQEAGRTVSEQEVIAAHPELADELREFFDDLGQMNELAPPVVSQPPVLDKIRYFGDYELLEEIARGGMGIVYKAKQSSLNRTVAVKLILSGHLASETDVKRFQTEAESAANLQHPHIVAVHEVGRHRGQNYFSMDYIDGKNLSEIVRDHPLPPIQAAGYVREVAEAIHYAHQQGTLHRDLKPSNILIDQNDRVQITDFGLAMKVEGNSELTRTGQVLGTPSYMPPEQAQHKRGLIGPGSDIYSMGAILYELLTGRPPFRAESSVETLRQVIESEPLSPRLLNPAIPKDLETICLKCLQKEPHKRYATAEHLADDLGHFLQGEPILARPNGRMARAWRWCKRRPAIASLLATVMMTLVAGTIISTYFAIEAGRRASETYDAQQRTIIQERLARASADLARRHLYIAHMNLVQGAWEDKRMGRMRYLLDQQLPDPGQEDLRAFEWYYWDRLCSIKNVLTGHHARVFDVAIDPQGTRIVSASVDSTIKIWDLRTGQEIQTLSGHTGPIMSVDFSPDGQLIASASVDGSIKLWSAANGAEVRTLTGHTASVPSVCFSPNGETIASASVDATVKLWETASGEELHTLQGYGKTAGKVTFNNDGSLVAASYRSGTGIVSIWNTTTGKRHQILRGHTSVVFDVAFSPDGMLMVTGCHDGTVLLWDLETGLKLRTFEGHSLWVNAVRFSPDGTQIASTGRDQSIRLWEISTGKEIRSLRGHNAPVSDIAFIPGRAQLVSSSLDETIKIWNLDEAHEYETLAVHAGAVNNLAYNRSGIRIATAGRDGTVKLCNVKTGAVLRSFQPHTKAVMDVAVSPDDKWIASTSWSPETAVWDAESGSRKWTTAGHSADRSALAFSPDGTQIATAYSNNEVKLFNVADGEESKTLEGHTGLVRGLTYNHDGTLIASASFDQTVRLWSVESGRLLRTLSGHSDWVHDVAFNDDGSLLASGSSDGKILLWDVTTGALLQTLRGHSGPVWSVDFSPDGRRLASASSDCTVKLWDVESRAEVMTLKGHVQALRCVEFSPDGKQIASGGIDTTVRFWNTAVTEPPLIASPDQTAPIKRTIALFRALVDQNPTDAKAAYRLANLLRYVGDIDGYHKVCRNMFDEYSKPDVKLSAHTLLMAYVFFPEADVTPEILKIAEQHAAGNNLINDRMLAMAYHRLGRNEEALPLLEAAAKQENAASDSKLTTWLSLALVQLKLERFDEAGQTIRDARLEYLRTAEALSDSGHRKPWGVITSLWREVESALEGTPVDEPIPQLPPLYQDLPRSEPVLKPLAAPRPE